MNALGWLALAGWTLVLVLVALIWRSGWRPWRPPPPARKAQLFNSYGRLDSVRTVTGMPLQRIVCRAGTYVLDVTAPGPHLTYRRHGKA